MEELLQRIADLLPEPNVEVAVLIPYDRGDLVSRLHLNSRILVLDYREGGTFVRAMVKPEMAAELGQYRLVI
jgi:GTP-binding protein HflX